MTNKYLTDKAIEFSIVVMTLKEVAVVKIRSRLREHIYRMSAERLQRGGSEITHEEISQATGLTRTTVTMWMNQNKPLKRIDSEAWVRLSKFVGIEPGELLVFDSDENPETKTHPDERLREIA